MDMRSMMPMQPGGQADPAVPSLMQMAQGEAPPQNYAPQWVMDEWNRTPAASSVGPDTGDGRGGSTGYTQDQLAPWYNPANWGPPPRYAEGAAPGYFPDVFGKGGDRGPGGKFWSWGDYVKQAGGQPMPEVMDTGRPNTLNWRLLGNPPPGLTGPGQAGDFMFRGHHINQDKLYNDLHRPVDTQEGAGIVGGSINFNRTFGPENTAWSTKGQLGLPGQLDPFAQMWGVGGP